MDEKLDHIQLLFFPNVSSRPLLPIVWSDTNEKWPVDKIELVTWESDQSEADALRMLLPPAQAEALISKRVLRAYGTASIVISDYRNSGDCDARRYYARLQKVLQATRVSVATAARAKSNC